MTNVGTDAENGTVPSNSSIKRLLRAFSFPLILLPISGLIPSGVLIAIALSSQQEPQSYENFTCGSNPTPDCLGWSIVLTGPFYPFYLLLHGLVGTLILLIAIAPAVLAFRSWIRQAAATELKRPRLTIVRFFQILYSDKPGPST